MKVKQRDSIINEVATEGEVKETGHEMSLDHNDASIKAQYDTHEENSPHPQEALCKTKQSKMLFSRDDTKEPQRIHLKDNDFEQDKEVKTFNILLRSSNCLSMRHKGCTQSDQDADALQNKCTIPVHKDGDYGERTASGVLKSASEGKLHTLFSLTGCIFWCFIYL